MEIKQEWISIYVYECMYGIFFAEVYVCDVEIMLGYLSA